MTHFGQLPGSICLIFKCIGHVYSTCGSVFAVGCKGAVTGLAGAYFSGAARNFAAQLSLQK